MNDKGRIVSECWQATPDHFPQVELDAFGVMPNHVHGISMINETVRSQHGMPLPILERFGKSVPGSPATIMRQYKSVVMRRIRTELGETGIWQRNYVYCDLYSVMNTSSGMKKNGTSSAVVVNPNQ